MRKISSRTLNRTNPCASAKIQSIIGACRPCISLVLSAKRTVYNLFIIVSSIAGYCTAQVVKNIAANQIITII